MATTKIWKIKSRFDNVIDYITNKNKTDNKKYVISWISYKISKIKWKKIICVD